MSGASRTRTADTGYVRLPKRKFTKYPSSRSYPPEYSQFQRLTTTPTRNQAQSSINSRTVHDTWPSAAEPAPRIVRNNIVTADPKVGGVTCRDNEKIVLLSPLGHDLLPLSILWRSITSFPSERANFMTYLLASLHTHAERSGLRDAAISRLCAPSGPDFDRKSIAPIRGFSDLLEQPISASFEIVACTNLNPALRHRARLAMNTSCSKYSRVRVNARSNDECCSMRQPFGNHSRGS